MQCGLHVDEVRGKEVAQVGRLFIYFGRHGFSFVAANLFPIVTLNFRCSFCF